LSSPSSGTGSCLPLATATLFTGGYTVWQCIWWDIKPCQKLSTNGQVWTSEEISWLLQFTVVPPLMRLSEHILAVGPVQIGRWFASHLYCRIAELNVTLCDAIWQP
jgi:hypothetical protein